MRLTWVRRRWRWLVTLVLLLLLGVIWFVIINRPPELAGRLIIERQENNNELFYEYDFVQQQLRVIPQDVTGIDVAFQISLSGDGKHATFYGSVGTENRIYVAEDNFRAVRPITTGPRDFKPQLSPDGSTIVFERLSGYFSALFALDVATGIERQLTEYKNDLEADWSPDGKQIVFTTSRDGFQELYTMAPDGSDLKRLTNNERQNDLEAQFSPDGKWIAYMTNYSVDDGTGEIWLMTADGQNQRRLTDNQQDDREPKWSPNSQQIVFTQTQLDRKGMDIFVYDLASGETHQLTTTSGYEFQPTWSPDSAWIAFTSNPSGDGQQLYVEVMRVDGTERHLLLAGSDNILPGRGFTWIQ